MNEPPLRISKPLRYVMRCTGCDGEFEVCPDELDDKLAVCPHCELPNATPIYRLLSGRKRDTDK